jgi:hypothetical protein
MEKGKQPQREEREAEPPAASPQQDRGLPPPPLSRASSIWERELSPSFNEKATRSTPEEKTKTDKGMPVPPLQCPLKKYAEPRPALKPRGGPVLTPGNEQAHRNSKIRKAIRGRD